MPYEDPVGMAVSVLWWGIYFGCFGMNLGAQVGLWAEQTPSPPSWGSAGVGKPSGGQTAPPARVSAQGVQKRSQAKASY
jgi:hypothetical protein